jgi:arabinose-5-phosphate isomerase
LENVKGTNVRYSDRAREVLDIEREGLTKVRDNLGDGFDRAVELLLAAVTSGNKIVVTGVGKNQPIGQKIAATLTSTGSPCVFLHAADAMHGDLGLLCPGDCVLALSYSGESDELRTLLPQIKRQALPIVAVTADETNALAAVSDAVIPVAVDREACPFNMAPTASTTATLAVGDALAMVLLDARGFTRDDYAKLHPSGAIGRTLLLRVGDVMRSEDRLPRIRAGQTVREAVVAMTEAKAGAVPIVDPDDRVVGIFTDGDLRRHLTTTRDLLDRPIDEVMTRDPFSLHRDTLAAEMLAQYQHRAIDDIVVVDDHGRLAGLVDIQDLPKFKIL